MQSLALTVPLLPYRGFLARVLRRLRFDPAFNLDVEHRPS